MTYRVETGYYEEMGWCFLLFMLLHHHISYKMLTKIAKQGDYYCGWAEAVMKSEKGGLFSFVVLSEKIPTSCKVLKRYRPTKQLINA